MNIQFNTVIAKTMTIADISNLDRDTVCIHPSGVTNVL